MYREVKINIPMFIGIILLVAVATTVLVLGVNYTKELILNANKELDEEFEQLENLVDTKIDSNEIEGNIEKKGIADSQTNTI